MEAYILAPDLGSRAHYYHHSYCYSGWSWFQGSLLSSSLLLFLFWLILVAHHLYRHCYSYRLILVPVLIIANVLQHLWRPIPFPALSDVQCQCEFNPTFGIFQQSEIVDSLCSSATFWQTSDQVKVTQARCRGMPSLDQWARKSENGQKNLFCTIVVCKSNHFSGSPQR